MWTVCQNVFHQIGENIARAELDKERATGSVEVFDLLGKEYRLKKMLRQLVLNGAWIGGIRLGRRIGIDWHRWASEGHGVDRLSKGLLRMSDQRRMKGGCHGQTGHVVAFGLQRGLGGFNRRSWPSQNNLIVRIPVRQMDTGQVLQLGLDLGIRTGDRQHCAGIEVRAGEGCHTCAARFDQLEVGWLIENTGSPQGGQFPKAVTGHKVSVETCFGKELVEACAQSADGRLGIIGALQSRGLSGPLVVSG